MTEFFSLSIPVKRGYFVYRYWLEEKCLYVGAVGVTRVGAASLINRLGRHARERSLWNEEADRIDYAVLSSQEEAKSEETAQIKFLSPRYNFDLNRCRKGLHDIRFPESRISTGKDSYGTCRECYNERMTPYLRQWKKDHPDDVKRHQETQQQRLGEEEWKRRHNKWSAEWRARQKDKAA